MAGLLHRERRAVEPFDLFEGFDRTLEDWLRSPMLRRPMTVTRAWTPADLIHVEEFHDDGTLVVRAELAGIDPEKDVELTVSNGLLHIEAERREEEESEERGYLHREIRYGSFARTLPLPDGVTGDDVTATYTDGILEIRVPIPEVEQPKRIDIATS